MKAKMQKIFGDPTPSEGSGGAPGHVESNLNECADSEDNATQDVVSEKDVENNVVQGVTPGNRMALKPERNSFVRFQSVKSSE